MRKLVFKIGLVVTLALSLAGACGDPDAGEGDSSERGGSENGAGATADGGDTGTGGRDGGEPDGCHASEPTTFTSDARVEIEPNTIAYSTIDVGVPDTYLWEIRLRTNLIGVGHVLVLESPAGTEIVLSDPSVGEYKLGGGYAENPFDGVVWDDRALDTVADYSGDDPPVSLVPEGKLGVFRGEDPNGTWTLKMLPDSPDTVLQGWSLEVVTLNEAPTFTEGGKEGSGTGTVDDDERTATLEVTDGGRICGLTLRTDLAGEVTDSEVWLTSPAGTTTPITTNAGDGEDASFDGTVWDDAVNTPVTMYVFAEDEVPATLSPNGALSAFLGEDSAGTWTIRVRNVDFGPSTYPVALYGWLLEFQYCDCRIPGAKTPPPDGGGAGGESGGSSSTGGSDTTGGQSGETAGGSGGASGGAGGMTGTGGSLGGGGAGGAGGRGGAGGSASTETCAGHCGVNAQSCGCTVECIPVGLCCIDFVTSCRANNSCVGLCGSSAPDCYCDSTCEMTGDCCPDYPLACR